MIADMHTHSEYSHDSECSIEEMCMAQIQNGTNIMAVTDHADIYLCSDSDIYSSIANSCKAAQKLNQKYNDKIRILTGVEMSEGFWFPEYSQKMRELCDYDVIIGSVHSVRWETLTMPYSRIDFSKLGEAELYKYLDAYFDDVITMIETEDFDVLAHLTCPLRYITGKYKRKINLECFNQKIKMVLSLIIKKEIALEVNTSSYDILNDFMPSRELIKEYYNMGGRLITLGSDAHARENASLNFQEALKYIKTVGFDKLYYFQNRKPIGYDI